MAAATRTKDTGNVEALIRVCEALGDRVELLEAAVGTLAASIHGVSGSAAGPRIGLCETTKVSLTIESTFRAGREQRRCAPNRLR
jgi:hypothetical protein